MAPRAKSFVVLSTPAMAAAQLAVQPGASKCPEAVAITARHPKRFGGLLHRQSGKAVEFDELGATGIVTSQAFQDFIEGQELLRGCRGQCIPPVKVEPAHTSAVFH